MTGPRELVGFSDMASMLERSVARFGGRPFIGEKRDGAYRWTTYAELGVLVDRLRGGLASLGVRRGDRVAVISNNRIAWVVGCYATYGLGAAYVPMYEAQLERDWHHILQNSGARLCFVATPAIRARVEAFAGDIPGLERVICFEGSGEGAYAGLLAVGAASPAPVERLDGSELANLIYTSGTTGTPKGVRLSHRSLAAEINGLFTALGLHEREEIRTLSILPWAHVGGGICELHGVASLGGAIGLCEAPEQLAQRFVDVKPTVFCAVPRVWNRLYDGVQKQVAAKPAAVKKLFDAAMRAGSKQKRGDRLTVVERACLAVAERLIFRSIREKLGGRLRLATSGAAALSPEVIEFIDNLGIGFYEGYGMTESAGIATLNTPLARRIGSVGKPLSGFQIRIDEGARPDGVSGEVLIYGDAVMDGYHDLPEETARVMTADGGVRSGDLGRLTPDGFLYVTGRVKELYKLENGKYVAPAPLEEQLTLSPYIAQAMIYGDGRPHNVALIVPDMAALQRWALQTGRGPEIGASPTERLLSEERTRRLIALEIERCSATWKGYERVRRFILIADELSVQNGLLTPTLKLKRKEIVARYGADLFALYGD